MAMNEADRRRLLLAPGIGPCVVRRLEAAGFESLVQLRALGVDFVVDTIATALAEPAWRNRRSALERVLRASA
jgi:hypothetical protein